MYQIPSSWYFKFLKAVYLRIVVLYNHNGSHHYGVRIAGIGCIIKGNLFLAYACTAVLDEVLTNYCYIPIPIYHYSDEKIVCFEFTSLGNYFVCV